MGLPSDRKSVSPKESREVHGGGVTIWSDKSTCKGAKGDTLGWNYHLVRGVYPQGSQGRCIGGVIWSGDYALRGVREGGRGRGYHLVGGMYAQDKGGAQGDFHLVGGVYPQESQRRWKRVKVPSGRGIEPTEESKEVHGGGVTIRSEE